MLAGKIVVSEYAPRHGPAMQQPLSVGTSAPAAPVPPAPDFLVHGAPCVSMTDAQ